MVYNILFGFCHFDQEVWKYWSGIHQNSWKKTKLEKRSNRGNQIKIGSSCDKVIIFDAWRMRVKFQVNAVFLTKVMSNIHL